MSIATQITRLTTLRNNIRTKLISLGILSSSATSATLSDCYDGINAVTAQSATTYTPTTSNQTIAAGKYLSGAQTISGDANLVPSNIKSGVSLFNVTGSYEGDTGKKQVFFIDYDGTVLYSYSASYANNMTELPPNPTHTGLVSQGWNWTLAQIKAQLTSIPNGPVWVGQLYTTSSGATEIDVEITENTKNPWFRFTINRLHVIDWGDGTTQNVTGSSLTASAAVMHTYSSAGQYTIKLSPYYSSNCEHSFYTNGAYDRLFRISKNGNTSSTSYAACVKAIRLGSGCVSIGPWGFSDCTSLEYITVSQSVTSFAGNDIFDNCSSLKSLTIPNGITAINSNSASYYSYCFNGCTSLKNVSLPSTIETIGGYAFLNCSSLKSITFSSLVSVLGIYQNCFEKCASLEEVHFPNSVSYYGNSSNSHYFRGCSSLKIVEGSAPGSLYSFDGCYSLTEVNYVSTLGIGQYAFEDCKSLKNVTISGDTTSIGSYAFYGCRSLESITLPRNITSISANAFQNCIALKSIVLPYMLSVLTNNEFSGCAALESVVIDSGVTTIQNTTFSGCYGLRAIYFKGTTPPAAAGSSWYSAFSTGTENYEKCTLYVPTGYLSAYTGATNYPSTSRVNYVEWDPT